MHDGEDLKPVVWLGTSQKDIRTFPDAVRRDIGQALYAAQKGTTDPAAKPLKGFGGHSVMEIVAPFDGNTWRGVYTVRFRGVVYVLHAFQKKSKTGIATPKSEIDLIISDWPQRNSTITRGRDKPWHRRSTIQNL